MPATPSAVTTLQDDVVNNIREESCTVATSKLDFSLAYEPSYWWGNLDGPTACKKFIDYYREAAHWKRN